MSRVIVVLSSVLVIGGLLTAQDDPKPFVEYPQPVADYLQRIQRGKQTFAFEESVDADNWQRQARAALVELIGLKGMAEQLADFQPAVTLGQAELIDNTFSRAFCSIETEPGVSIPFYLLIPKAKDPKRQFPLILCPHGHDTLGLHSYAGAFKDAAHRKKILDKEGNIAEQAACRGFVAIAPATRGLAQEVSIPDPKGRHGNRPCRAQLIHCLLGGRTPMGERVWDMQRLIDWAQTHPSVDEERIAMTGNSGGGVLTAYTAAIDTRIQAAVPSCSFTSASSSDGFIFHCDCCLVPRLRDWGDWAEIGGLVAPRHLLIVHGTSDGLHHRPDVNRNAAAVHRIFKARGAGDRMSIQWADGGHRFYPDLMWPFIDQAFADAKESP